MLDFSKFYEVPATFEADGFQSADAGIKGIFLAGPEFEGRETRVFAWYGVPENASVNNKVPGIVLVHGGDGTAFSVWVKHWVDRGYAAIAIDMFGGLPAKDGGYAREVTLQRFEYSGPDFTTKFADVDLPAEEQWAYHAVAAIISANSFLASLPEVYADKIGLTGISWGGFATALTAGYDSRFRFVMPVYGCGGIESQSALVSDDASFRQLKKFASLWDPDNTLAQAKMPILWVNGANDFFFDVKTWNKSSSLCARSYRALYPTLIHGQTQGEQPIELAAFAQTVLAGKDFPHFVKVQFNEQTLQIGAKWSSTEKIVKADVCWTRAEGCLNDALFRVYPAKMNRENDTVVGDLPEDWTVAYLSIEDANGCRYTSEIFFNE